MNKPRSFEKLWRKRFENFAARAEDDAGIAGWSTTGLDARLRKFKEIWNNSGAKKISGWTQDAARALTHAFSPSRVLISSGWIILFHRYKSQIEK